MEIIKAIDFKACVPVAITQSVIKMMPDAMVVGRCKDCKHYDKCDEFDPYDWQEDDCYICRMAVSVGGTMQPDPPNPNFGCVEWEATEET